MNNIQKPILIVLIVLVVLVLLYFILRKNKVTLSYEGNDSNFPEETRPTVRLKVYRNSIFPVYDEVFQAQQIGAISDIWGTVWITYLPNRVYAKLTETANKQSKLISKTYVDLP